MKTLPTPGGLARPTPAVDSRPALVVRVILWVLPFSAAIGGVVFTVDVGPVPMYPFKVIVPLVFFATLVFVERSRQVEMETWIVLGMFGWAALGATWALDPMLALQSASVFAFAAMLFVTLHLWGARVIGDVILGWRIALVATALVAAWELLSGQHLATAFVADREGFVNGLILSVFNNPNDYGAFLAIAIPISLYPVRGRIPPWVWGLAAGSAGLLVLSASRFALIGLLGAVITALVRSRRRWWTAPSAWVGFLVGAVACVVLVVMGAGIAEKFLVLAQPGALGDTSAGVRLALIADGLWAAADSGGAGLGGGGFEFMVRSGNAPVTVREGVVNPHNMWIELIAELGLPGLFLFIALLAVIWGRVRRRHRPAETEATVLWASLVGYVLAVCTSSAYLASPVSWMFLATVSLISLNICTRPRPAPLGGHSGLLSAPHLVPLGRGSAT